MNLIHFLLIFNLVTGLLLPVANAESKPRTEPAAAGQATQDSATAAALPATPTPLNAIPATTRRTPFTWLGAKPVLALRTTDGGTTINFGSRMDELVTKAALHLHYTYSPALIAAQSHIKVSLNDIVIGVLPVSKENAGRTLPYDIDIDPRLIVDTNRLTFNFIGHYSTECEDPMHSSLWANISGSSELELTTRPLAVSSDLAMLPEPFLDRGDQKRLNLPFVFGAQPSRSTLQVSAVIASWFGHLAAWRGARFPAHLDSVPAGHAIVFATNTERPAFLEKMPPITAPGLRIIANPTDGYSKLLLVLGRDGKDLKMAADALTLGSATLSGSTAVVTEVQEKSRQVPQVSRQAYDAPNWVRMDRAMKFGELIGYPQQLQASGHVPEPIRINLRIPPDLFTWRSRGVPMDVRFRYTPPLPASESRLSMSVNDEMLKVVNLRTADQGGDPVRLRFPLLEAGLLGDGNDVIIPAFKLGSRSELQFAFNFVPQKIGNCRDVQVDNVRAAVDADSTIDFSGYLHYAEMPNLGYFASVGFPFTKYADLSQTVIVLPQQPSRQDIEIMLALLGRMGESTGYPATGVTLAGPEDETVFNDADILVIGTLPQQSLLAKWSSRLPAGISGPLRRISQPARNAGFLYEWLGFGTAADASIVSQQQIESIAPLAALLGFESPLTAHRSVVAITAVSPEDMVQVLDALGNPGMAKAMHGSAVFVHPKKVESVLAGPTYVVGSLPFWTDIWFRSSEHPVLLAMLALLTVLVFGFAYWRKLKAAAARRLQGDV